jgi:hypothetical protein
MSEPILTEWCEDEQDYVPIATDSPDDWNAALAFSNAVGKKLASQDNKAG